MTEVVAALIRDKRKFLIFQRPENKNRGLLWEFIGGKVEPGETNREALIRECMEEAAMTVNPGELFFEVVHNYPDITIHLSVYLTDIGAESPTLLEHNDMAWITPEEIEMYEFCPADKDILNKIKENF